MALICPAMESDKRLLFERGKTKLRWTNFGAPWGAKTPAGYQRRIGKKTQDEGATNNGVGTMADRFSRQTSPLAAGLCINEGKLYPKAWKGRYPRARA